LAVMADIVLLFFSALLDEFQDSTKSAMTTCFLIQFTVANQFIKILSRISIYVANNCGFWIR
jgi:hypothetical protein